jgi:3-hydroxyisobutyrate dehydrogenase-like beta-hydroxyacid dehydrogenase
MASEDTFAKKVGFVGLGAMGFGMASHLLRCGYQVCGYDVAPSQLAAFAQLGGLTSSSPREAATDSRILVVVVANYSQADSVFFHEENGAVQSLPKDGTIVLCATVPPSYYQSWPRNCITFPANWVLLVP